MIRLIFERLPYRAFALVIFIAFSSSGCTYHQLRKNTVGQAVTINELHQQQVLDNLAMFSTNPDSLPFFALPTQGTSEINDRGNFSPVFTWSRFATAPFVGDVLLNTAQTTLTAERAAKQNWTLNPINDPRKLELMRCAYQHAVSGCVDQGMPGGCPDCQQRFNRFYTGDKDTAPSTLNVTTTCLACSCDWFCVGRKCDVPHCCDSFVGKYCDTYVWVPPEGRDQLSKLTLVILDFALNDPKKPNAKEVVHYLDGEGRFSDMHHAATRVTATVAITDTNQSVLAAPYASKINAILQKHGIPSADLDRRPLNEIVVQIAAANPTDAVALVELLHRAGYLPEESVKSFKANGTSLDGGSEIEANRIQLTPTPVDEGPSRPSGTPPLLQLNQLLETVR